MAAVWPERLGLRVSVNAFVEVLGNIGPNRMISLVNEGTVGAFYVLVGPDEGRPAAPANRIAWFDTDELSAQFVPRYGWWVATADQESDVREIQRIDASLNPAGWVLNIEKVLQSAPLEVLLSGVKALGKPMVASLAGTSASHTQYDFRVLDKHGVTCDWQAYFDSGEGQSPAYSVAELYQSSFVISGWEYRHRLGSSYGWGKVREVQNEWKAWYDSYKRPPIKDGWFYVDPREWGYTVESRTLYRDSKSVGLLMGRAAYSRIAVTLDVTRGAQDKHSLTEWEAIAASARVPGAKKRPVSVYLCEIARDDVLRAIAAGAG